MRFAVIGAGGVGGYFGGKLAHAGADVTFLARGATLDALRTNGLRVDSVGGDFVVPRINATDDAATAGAVDVVLVATKTWQIADAAERMKGFVGDNTVIVPLQNGLDAPRQLADAFGAERVLGGLCGIVAFIVAPGHIRHAGTDPFIMFGELDNRRSERVERLQQALVAAGIAATVPSDIHHTMWTKFLFIAPMSGIGAITRVPVGVWRAMPETRELATAMLREMTAVAAAKGVTLEVDAVERTLERFDAMPPGATSSMQRDVMGGKRSELDAQLGTIVRLGRETGVPTPVSEIVYSALLPQERAAAATA